MEIYLILLQLKNSINQKKKQIKISKPVWIKIKWNNSSARDQWFLYPNLNGEKDFKIKIYDNDKYILNSLLNIKKK